MESHEKNARAVGATPDPTRTDHVEMSVGANGLEAQPPKPKLKDLDDLLPYLGDFGWYQRILFLLMIPYSFFFAFVYFGQIFMTVVPEEHWCYVPELQGLGVEERRHLSIPLIDNKYDKCSVYDVNWTEVLQNGTLQPNPEWGVRKCENRWEFNYTDVPYESIASQFDKCSVYDVNWTEVLQNGTLQPNPEWGVRKCENRWEFNYTDVPYESIASQQGWVCERDNYPATAQAIFFCGGIAGGFIFGWIADKYGRIPALIGANLSGFVGGVGSVFTNDFWSFCLCRFIVGLAYDNCFIIMYIVVLEYVGLKWRTFVANMSIAVYFTFAACLLPWIALAVNDWKIYTLIISVPLALAVLTPCVVPESARWLIAQGRIDEAIKIMQKCERINKKKIPDEVIEEFRVTATEIAKAEHECKNYSVLDLVKTPRLRRHSILLVLIWMSIAMVFDGHVRNVGSLGLDMFKTFTVATFTEFPADILLILTLDVIGRRWLAFGTMVISGIFSLLATTAPIGIASASLAIVGRFAVNISYNIGMQYAAELLPTVVRAQGVALIHITGIASASLAIVGRFAVNISYNIGMQYAAELLPTVVRAQGVALIHITGIASASLAIVGRFAVNISYNIGMQYAAELLPTVVRAQGVALIHITGYVATILTPYIVYMATIAREIPLLILGALGIFGGSLCLFLPESMGKEMPQTIQDGEEYGLDQKFWDFPCCNRKKNKKVTEEESRY